MKTILFTAFLGSFPMLFIGALINKVIYYLLYSILPEDNNNQFYICSIVFLTWTILHLNIFFDGEYRYSRPDYFNIIVGFYSASVISFILWNLLLYYNVAVHAYML